MGDFNSIQGCMEVPMTGGILYLAAQVENLSKARYEDWMEGRVRRRSFELLQAKEIDVNMHRESQKLVRDGCASGTFSWGGMAWLDSLRQLPGIVALSSILASDPESGAREKNGGIITPQAILSKYAVDAISREMLEGAISQIIEKTPNFTAPPVRGEMV